jgi:hypothetical protein
MISAKPNDAALVVVRLEREGSDPHADRSGDQLTSPLSR